ncbi:MAG: hybrid sensor histidine kinase/response regulator [Candidatus Wallbacteria bacterium]|nr:hybrid sensor histidine kinase/response regulator [Candidatus Wallbacteria bacterium]
MPKTRALVIEDNPVDAQFIRQMLTKTRGDSSSAPDFEVTLADRLASGIDELVGGGFDIVLVDLTLPDSKGLETFRRIHDQVPELPVVVLTGDGDETVAIEAVKSGAQDYLVKGLVTANVLTRFLRYAIERHRLLEDVKRLARESEARELRIRGVMERLWSGFERLAQGDFKVRVSPEAGAIEESSELSGLLERFDSTVERLDELSSLSAQFRSMAAHDIRSPLSSVFCAMPLLATADTPPDRRKSTADMVTRNLRKVLRLMDDLLDFFVITSGQVQLLLEDVSITELVHDCARGLEWLAADRGQRISVHSPDGELTLRCDRMKLVRVLDNLVGNAIKYSRESDTIQVKACAAEAGQVRLEVSDHGDGIPETEHVRIFERFHRSTHSDRKIKGSGLGLAICRDYVQAHGGQIWVESRTGTGATFVVLLPPVPPAPS